MDILKIAIFIIIAVNFSFAKVDFVKFGDICEANSTLKCKNNPLEVKAVQYLLKKRVNSNIVVSGKVDRLTIDTIKTLQLKEHINSNGYIGKETKDILNKLLYGTKLHNKQTSAKSEKNHTKIAYNTPKKFFNISYHIRDKEYISKGEESSSKAITFKSYNEFKRSVDLRKSYAVYQDDKLLKFAGKKATLLKVDISEQRVKLLVEGKVALDAPCTTGSKHKLEPNTRTFRDKRTPKGIFKIMEKIATKRSTIFGDLYRNGKRIYHGDRRKYKGSWKGVKFVGAPLKNWMRLTSSGIGFHASTHVKRYPGSNGCIRLLPKVAKTLFKKIKRGTIVKVVN